MFEVFSGKGAVEHINSSNNNNKNNIIIIIVIIIFFNSINFYCLPSQHNNFTFITEQKDYIR